MADQTDQIEGHKSRRALIVGAGAVGLAGVLAACSGENDTPGATPTTKNNAAPKTGTPNPASDVLAKKSDIPVGGGKIIGDEGVVITQPTAGRFVGLSAICTHRQCILAKIEGGLIKCGCHGSEFSIKDGSVKEGPANEPLEKVTLKIDGDNIKFG